MTRLAARLEADVAMALAGLCLAALSFVFLQPMFAIGAWPEDAAIVAIHAAAGLCAAGLAVTILRNPAVLQALIGCRLLWPCAALAVWSAAVAPFSSLPWLSVLGAPENGQGALQFTEIAVFIAATLRVSRDRIPRRVLAVTVIVAAWLAAALQLFPQTRPEVFSEYLAHFGLPAMVVGYAVLPRLNLGRHWGRGRGHLARPLAAAVCGVPVMLASSNRTAIILAVLTAVAVMLGMRSSRVAAALRNIRFRHVMAGAAGALPLIAVFAIYTWGLDQPVLSIRARALLFQVMFSALRTTATMWLWGGGWGQTETLFATHLSAASVALWQDSWDAARRDIFHSHNEALEALLAAGMPGMVAMLAFLAVPIWAAPRRLLPVASFYAVCNAGLAALWFQLPFTVPLMAIAYASLAGRLPAGNDGRPLQPQRVQRTAGAALAGGLAIVALAVAVYLLRFGLAVNATLASDGLPRVDSGTCAGFPADDWRGNNELADMFARSYQPLLSDAPAGQVSNPAQFPRLAAFFCTADARAAPGTSPYLMVVTLIFRGEIALRPQLADARALLGDAYATWRLRLFTLLNLAPLRTDIAASYFGWLLQEDQTDRLLRDSEILIQRNPADPVGLWFSGVALLKAHADSPELRKLALARLNGGLRSGIDRILPVDDDVRNKILRSE